MRAIIQSVVILALAAAIGACGSDSPTAPTNDSLAGIWKATRAELVNAANPSQRVEVISQGATIVLTLQSSGAYNLTATVPGEAPETETGAWSNSKDVLTLRPTGVTYNVEFDMTFSGSALALSGGHVQFDINGDNADEETILSMNMTRQ